MSRRTSSRSADQATRTLVVKSSPTSTAKDVRSKRRVSRKDPKCATDATIGGHDSRGRDTHVVDVVAGVTAGTTTGTARAYSPGSLARAALRSASLTERPSAPSSTRS